MDWVWAIISSMMAVLGSSWFAVVIHEYSHYLLGRAVGVPREKIKVRMKPWPLMSHSMTIIVLLYRIRAALVLVLCHRLRV